jgi:hypothetical protein
LLSARDCLFNIFAASLHSWRPFLHPQPEDAPCCGAVCILRACNSLFLFVTDNISFLKQIFLFLRPFVDRLCGLVVRVLGYRSGGPDSFPGTTRKKCSVSGPGSTQPREYKLRSYLIEKERLLSRKPRNTAGGIRHADHVAPSIRTSLQSLRRQAAVARSV